MRSRASRRQRGGVSRSIDYLARSITDPAQDFERGAALHEIAKFVRTIFDQASEGERHCGYFLAELLAFLIKRRLRLEKLNETFRSAFLTWESSRPKTIKDTALRRLIERILSNAIRERRDMQMAKHIQGMWLLLKRDEVLIRLPEFSNTPDAIRRWSDAIVYPRLRSMAGELRDHPIIGSLPAALDRNHKFQISRLKPLVRQTVARIAAIPQRYYFDIS
jgi:hypothetical protein